MNNEFVDICILSTVVFHMIAPIAILKSIEILSLSQIFYLIVNIASVRLKEELSLRGAVCDPMYLINYRHVTIT